MPNEQPLWVAIAAPAPVALSFRQVGGKPLALGGSDRRLWAQTGHAGPIVGLHLGPDHATTVDADGVAIGWHRRTGAEVSFFSDRDRPFVGPVTAGQGKGEVLLATADGAAVRDRSGAEGDDPFGFVLVDAAGGATGLLVDPLRLDPPDERPWGVAAAWNGVPLVVHGIGETVVVRRLDSPKPVRVLRGVKDGRGLAASPDGNTLAVRSGGRVTIHPFSGQPIAIPQSAFAMAFSGDGTRLALGNDEGVVIVDLQGRLVGTHRTEAPVRALALDALGEAVLVSHGGPEAVLLRRDGTRTRLAGRTVGIRHAQADPRGRSLGVALDDGTVRMWDLVTGDQPRVLYGLDDPLRHVAVDDGLVAASDGDDVAIWRTRRFERGRVAPTERMSWRAEVRALAVLRGRVAIGSGTRVDLLDGDRKTRGHRLPGPPLALHVDGNRFLVASGPRGNRPAALTALGRRSRQALSDAPTCVHADDGVRAVGFEDGRVEVYEDAERIAAFDHGAAIRCVAVAEDGEMVASGGGDGVVRVWRPGRVKPIAEFREDAAGEVLAVGFLAGGKRLIFSAHDDSLVRLWKAPKVEPVAPTEGRHRGLTRGRRPRFVRGLTQSPQTHVMPLTPGEASGGAQVGGGIGGGRVGTLVAFPDGGWAVVDADGRFDSSGGGEVDGLHFVADGAPLKLGQLRDRYYEPGLLAKLTGFDREAVRSVAPVTALSPEPDVHIERIGGSATSWGIRVENSGGGIGDIVVLLNRNDVTAHLQPGPEGPDAQRYRLDLEGLPAFRRTAENTIEVRAFNAEGTVHSRGGGFLEPLDPPPAEPERRMRAIVAGVSRYANADLDLRYPSEDAAAFAATLDPAARELLGSGNVDLTLLTTESGTWTKADFLAALADLSQAGEHDSVVLYLAGHGVSLPTTGGDEEFFYLCPEATAPIGSMTSGEAIAAVSVSGAEMRAALVNSPAPYRVMILDTCASGRFVTGLEGDARVTSDHERALERMKDRSDTFVLAGSAADRVSYEATRFGHGILTYCVLDAIVSGDGLRAENIIDAVRVGQFARTAVPRLAQDIGGVQVPVVKNPHGDVPIDLGLVTDRDALPKLKRSRPIFLPTRLQHADQIADVNEVGRLVDAALRAAEDDGTLQFFDLGGHPDGHTVVGRYRKRGGWWRLTGRVAGVDGEVFSLRTKTLTEMVEAVVRNALEEFGS